MIKHILIDVLSENPSIKSSILGKLSEKCRVLFEENTGDHEIKFYYCNKGTVYVQRRSNTLLLDLIESEDVFEAILEALPRENLMIRLIERGVPGD